MNTGKATRKRAPRGANPTNRRVGDLSAAEAVAAADRLDPEVIRRGGFVSVNFGPGRVRAVVYDSSGTGNEMQLIAEAVIEPGHSEAYQAGRVLTAARLVRRLFQELAAIQMEASRPLVTPDPPGGGEP